MPEIRKATISAITTEVVNPRELAVAPVMTIDSPRAMITKDWKRSAKWAPSTSQSRVCERPSHGVT